MNVQYLIFIMKIFLRKNFHLLLAILCIALWALYFLLRVNFNLQEQSDVRIFYLAGKILFSDPEKLYNIGGYFYLPSFALFMSVSFSLLPYNIAIYSFYAFNFILGTLFTIEFDKILKLENIENKFHRFLFLITLSNGWIVYGMFFFNQSKYLVSVLLILLIKREIEYTKGGKERDLQFYIINFNLIIFAIAMVPQFIFFLFVYIFYQLKPTRVFDKEVLKKCGLILLIFIAQNFLFFIYPNLILEFLQGINDVIDIWYLREWIFSSKNFLIVFAIIGIVIEFFIFLIIILKDLIMIEKFGYISISMMVFLIYFGEGNLIIIEPFIMMLYTPFLQKEEKGIFFIRNNKFVLLGLMSIAGLNANLWEIQTYFKYFPQLEGTIFEILIHLRWIFCFCIMFFSLFYLKFKEKIN